MMSVKLSRLLVLTVTAVAITLANGFSTKALDSDLMLKIVDLDTETVFLRDGVTVQIKNTTAHPINIWQENCSWGYPDLSITVQAGEQKLKLVRTPKPFRANVPSIETLKPGGATRRVVDLKDGTWAKEPLTKFATAHPQFDMQLHFDIPKDTESQRLKVWTGSITTPSINSTY